MAITLIENIVNKLAELVVQKVMRTLVTEDDLIEFLNYRVRITVE